MNTGYQFSLSVISQQIKKPESELGVQLLDRHNRTFSLTPAGEHFYRKSLVITSDIEQLIREVKRMYQNDHVTLHFGYYKGYYENELTEAISIFSQKYPAVEIHITAGSHKELYEALENNTVDLVLSDQRRAFSGMYNNLILSESSIAIEISARNPLSKLKQIEIDDLKNTPCILVANEKAQEEEWQYYEKIVGLKGDYIFVNSVQEARLKIVTGHGYMPVDVIGEQVRFDTTVSRIPLVRKSEPIQKVYCAFWKKDNSGYYIEEFSDILKNNFKVYSSISNFILSSINCYFFDTPLDKIKKVLSNHFYKLCVFMKNHFILFKFFHYLLKPLDDMALAIKR